MLSCVVMIAPGKSVDEWRTNGHDVRIARRAW